MSSGYLWAKKVTTKEKLIKLINQMRDFKGPALLEVQVKKGFRKDLGRPTISPLDNKYSFMEFLEK